MEQQQSYYAIIPATVRYDKDLPFGAKMLYGEITALSNQRGYCFAQNAYFAKLYDLTISTISRWISKLVKKGYLTLEIIYKEGTKAVDERRLYINDIPGSSAYTPMQSAQGVHCKTIKTPLCKKAQDNNTRVNNTINNKTIGESQSDSVAPQRTDWQSLLSLWNEKCHLNNISEITQKRKQHLGTRLKEHGTDSFLKVINEINNSPFLKGQNDRSWIATFDWVIKPSNYVKILEGNYSDKKPQTKGPSYGTVL